MQDYHLSITENHTDHEDDREIDHATSMTVLREIANAAAAGASSIVLTIVFRAVAKK